MPTSGCLLVLPMLRMATLMPGIRHTPASGDDGSAWKDGQGKLSGNSTQPEALILLMTITVL